MEHGHDGPEQAEAVVDSQDSDTDDLPESSHTARVGFHRGSYDDDGVSTDGRWSRRKRYLFVIGASVTLWTTIILLWSRH